MLQKTTKKITNPNSKELDDPPRSSQLGLYHAVCERKDAEMEMTVSKIMNIRHKLSNDFDCADLVDRKSLLNNLFVDSNKNITDNMASRSRFHEIIRSNMLDISKLQEQICNMKNEIIHYKNVAADMEKHVENYSVYVTFLEKVVQVSPEFKSGGYVLNRFEALENSRLVCSQVLELELEGASDMRRNMTTILETKSARLKDLGNKIIALRVRQKEVKERRMFWERMVERTKAVTEKRREEALTLSGGCWDLYLQTCATRKVKPTLLQSDIKGQLDFIVKTINFLKDVNTIVNSNLQALKN